MLLPKLCITSSPTKRATSPSKADTLTWPNPHRKVTRAVRPADQDRPRATAANGTQWSGAKACSEPTVMAPMRRVRNMVNFHV